MIINDKCYKDVKNSLDDLRAKTAGLTTISGAVQHEIDIRIRDIELYESVASGRYPLPDLARFKSYALSLPLQRIRKGLSAKAVAECSKIPMHEGFAEAEIIAFELTDYLATPYGYASAIAYAIDDAPAASNEEIDEVTSTNEELLQKYLGTLGKNVEKQIIYGENWFTPNLHGELSLAGWKEKCLKLNSNTNELPKDNSRFFDDFGEALNMWRVAKKWSYKQLADEAGIEWLMLWHMERSDYYGALMGTMFAIAEAIQKEHEPKEYSFEPEFRDDERDGNDTT